MHVEDFKRPVAAWLLVCRLLRDEKTGELSTWGLMRAMYAASAGLYGQHYTAVLRCCRSLEESGIIKPRQGRAQGKRPAALYWSLTTTGREWLGDELARVYAALGIVTRPRKT
jgi:DNA-binding PadR family transcriptional regulator